MLGDVQASSKAKSQRKEIFKRAESYVQEYRQQVSLYAYCRRSDGSHAPGRMEQAAIGAAGSGASHWTAETSVSRPKA